MTTTRKISTLLIIGLLVSSISQIFNYYFPLPDWGNGLLLGIGMGLLLITICTRRYIYVKQ